MTEASGPHVLCDATRLLVDPSRFNRARCPKHRRGYLCQSPTYHRYARGAFGLACAWPSLRLEDFPKDHLRDIMEAVQTFPDADLPQVPGACTRHSQSSQFLQAPVCGLLCSLSAALDGGREESEHAKSVGALYLWHKAAMRLLSACETVSETQCRATGCCC